MKKLVKKWRKMDGKIANNGKNLKKIGKNQKKQKTGYSIFLFENCRCQINNPSSN